jgi:hypothetical protein
MSPETSSALRVPTDVMFGWAFPVTATAVPTVPATFDAFRFEIADPLEAVIKPATVRALRIPTEVMFGWAFPVTVPAVPTVPRTFAPVRFERPDAFPE